MALPLDNDGNKKREKTSKSKYHLDDSERKLPRPVVFWSDNEKDAFRRNKVVQTRYFMLLDDIDTQQKSSEKSIRHEAHKFRRRYKADIVCASDNISSCGQSDVTSLAESTKKKKIVNKPSTSDSETESEPESWTDVPTKGVITKLRKTNVKFSCSDDVPPDDDASLINVVKVSTEVNHQRQLRSQSAIQSRANKKRSSNPNRSKSALLKTSGFSYEGDCGSSSWKTKESDAENNNNKPSRKPNSIFFDRSQAAYQLRKDLQKLAKCRKSGVVKVAYTREDAIRDERDRLVQSSKKVAEYIQRLEIDKQSSKISEWTTKTIEPVF